MYFVTEIDLGDFATSSEDAPHLPVGRYKSISRCPGPLRREDADIVKSILKLEPNERLLAVKAIKHFISLARFGKPLIQLVDEKKVHEAFKPFYCQASQKKETVWRYRRGDVRILFFYADGKIIFLTDIVIKRKDQLSTSEQKSAIRCVEDYLNAELSNSIKWI